jgi:23S rRNA (adenine2503-C2)-methyltransferase
VVELGVCGHVAGGSSGGNPRPRRVGIHEPPERGHGRTVPATEPCQRRTLARVPTRYDVDRDALAGILAGEPRYRVGQVWDGLYRQLASPAELTALPLSLRARLDRDLPAALAAVTESIDGAGATVKWLFGLDGGARIETVLMHYRDRTTVCVSTQAGCAMACGFCATGQAGFQRHLSTGEIVEQIVRAARRARDDGRRLGNVVFMGMGEPLANYDRVWPAVERAHRGLGLSARHLTLSTVGLVPGIRRLATEDLPVNLAVSLHAANDGLRDELVPINRRYPLSVLMGACADYVRAKGRRLSFEWALIDGTNDRRTDARELADLARALPLPAHVNLIPLNPTPGYPTRGTPPDGVRRFRGWLRDLGVNATVRRNRGADIDAACGQLAARAAVGADNPARAAVGAGNPSRADVGADNSARAAVGAGNPSRVKWVTAPAR